MCDTGVRRLALSRRDVIIGKSGHVCRNIDISSIEQDFLLLEDAGVAQHLQQFQDPEVLQLMLCGTACPCI